MRKIDRKYLAGLFDGRGSVSLLPNKTLRVGFRMSKKLPKMLKREFGGTCFKNDGKWWFRVQGENARFLLVEILPFLIGHKKRVQRLLTKNGRVNTRA